MTIKAQSNQGSLGRSLRYWRKAKKVSQLYLALEANISARHLSFIETGKTQPSREVVLQLASALKLSLRQCNTLLSAAGYTPEYHQYDLDAPQMGEVKYALKRLLNQHEPFPAFVVNQSYDLLMLNQGFHYLMSKFVHVNVVAKYKNFYRLIFAKDGLQPFFLNWSLVGSFLLTRLQQEAMVSQNQRVQTLFDELISNFDLPKNGHMGGEEVGELPVISFKLRKEDCEMHFFSTITTFGAPQDITVQELRIETLFPANEVTHEIFFPTGKRVLGGIGHGD